MLGNWSLGDYFKTEAIKWSYEFLTDSKYLGLDKNKLAFSVFAGDNNAPFDQESYDTWTSLGIAPERIAKLGKSDNWWGPAGLTGPCGPDTEMFYWTGEGEAPTNFQATHEDKNWVEIWNDVFMAYNKNADGTFSELAQKNVDTGMGLERVLGVINGIEDIYQTDLFSPIIKRLEELSGKKYADDQKSFRVIADHLRAVTFIIGDNKGVAPSNTDQGYIVRRLIRRAIRYGRTLNITGEWTVLIAKIYIDNYQTAYPELKQNEVFILNNLSEEEVKFAKTLERGLKEFSKLTGNVSGALAFDLYQSYGFPLEMTEELAREAGHKVDVDGFNQELIKHQDLSRTASVGKFKGGLADDSVATSKLHTATHLLLAALKKVLGEEVNQKGSNITADRLRLDFSYNGKPTPEQLTEIARLVNEVIDKDLPISCQEMTLEEAKAKQAVGIFESKYGDMVKVYTVGQEANPFSREICGGPHATNTGELGHFTIMKEEASSAGVRRIKAILAKKD